MLIYLRLPRKTIIIISNSTIGVEIDGKNGTPRQKTRFMHMRTERFYQITGQMLWRERLAGLIMSASRMVFGGLRSQEEIVDVIEFLRQETA